MLKRFTLGLICGLGIMYYYLYKFDQDVDSAEDWGGTAAGNYRGDDRLKAANDIK